MIKNRAPICCSVQVRLIYLSVLLFTFIIVTGCSNERDDITPVEERVAEAKKALIDDLTAPANGWRLEYSPTSEAGMFFMLLDFNDDGLVTIQSDVVDNEGEFVEQTIPYRIDNALSLELIFETYGVFHYLFELNRAQFGAEFEFLFIGKDDDNLLFSSKTDFNDVTIIELQPASPGDENLFSLEESENLEAFNQSVPQIFSDVIPQPIQQVVLEDKNMSVFWSIDITKRVISVDMVGTGATETEVIANNDITLLNHITGYTLLGGSLVLLEPLTFNHNGDNVTIAEVEVGAFSMTGPSFCSLNVENTAGYEGQIPGVGAVTVLQSLLDSSGFGFQPMEERPYSVNVSFVFNENGRSLFDEGIIGERFPNATGFAFNYDFDSEDQPAYAVGFYVEDESGDTQIYLREFTPTTTEGNKIMITLTNDFYYSDTPAPDVEQNLIDITNIIFEGGDMYAYDLEIQGTSVFRLYNPCNQYQAFLVQ